MAHAEPSSPQQNPACNRAFTHPRCTYQWGQVGTLTRQGIVCRPETTAGAPLVLAFHGHGGCSFQMALSTRIHDEWPEAMVVYLDGLPGISTPHDPAGQQTGWQLYPDMQDNRDVSLVDAVIDSFSMAYSLDPARVHAIGHSNGSRFTGVLWAVRGERFRSFIFNAAQPGDLLTRYREHMPARATALTMGRTDCVVPFNAALGCTTPIVNSDNYQEASVNLARRQLGIPEGPTPADKSLETGTSGKELGIYVHGGGHEWPAEQTQLAVRFMQRN